MGKKIPKYQVLLENEEKQKSRDKSLFEQNFLARKIKKSSNLDILRLFTSGKYEPRTILSSIHNSNNIEFWNYLTGKSRSSEIKDKVYISTLIKILEKSDNFIDVLSNAKSVESISDHIDSAINPLENWISKRNNPSIQFRSLIDHLFCKYTVPEFLYESFTKDSKSAKLLVHFGSGKSIRKFDHLPEYMPLNNKVYHHLFTTPNGLSFYSAFRRAQVLSMGGSEDLVRGILRSRIGNTPTSLVRLSEYEEFFATVVQFFIPLTMFDMDKVSEIIDYIWNQKFQATRVRVGDAFRMEIPHQNFSMKGRTPESLLRQSDEWHAEQYGVRRNKTQKSYVWDPVKISDYIHVLEKKDDVVYETYIMQLLSSKELTAEGNSMKHCVGSYAGSCSSGRCAIFSVRDSLGERFATIEVRGTEVVQVRAKYNRKPDDKTIKHIGSWVAKENLTISNYAY